jgi:hypothetical protein
MSFCLTLATWREQYPYSSRLYAVLCLILVGTFSNSRPAFLKMKRKEIR